jgi:hypothetical protein
MLIWVLFKASISVWPALECQCQQYFTRPQKMLDMYLWLTLEAWSLTHWLQLCLWSWWMISCQVRPLCYSISWQWVSCLDSFTEHHLWQEMFVSSSLGSSTTVSIRANCYSWTPSHNHIHCLFIWVLQVWRPWEASLYVSCGEILENRQIFSPRIYNLP